MMMTSMENLLLDVLPQHNGWKRYVETLSVVKNRLPFTLCDTVACRACGDRNMHCGNQEVARFSMTGDNEVISVGIEEYLMEYAKHYKKAQGCKCDYLHYDNGGTRVVLNELTCSQEKFVNPYQNQMGRQDGKRIHAMKQMDNVVGLLMEVPNIAALVNGFTDKHCLFSWRIPERDVNVAEQAMNAFMAPQRNVANITIMNPMNSGFLFVQQIYPCEYRF